MCKLTTMQRVNAYLDDLLAEGWQVLRDHKHLVLGSPDGSIRLTLPKTAKDGSSTPKNSLALLKRKRREWYANPMRGNGNRI